MKEAEVKALLAEWQAEDEEFEGVMLEVMIEENRAKFLEHLKWTKEECKNKTNPGSFIKDEMLVAFDVLFDTTEVLAMVQIVDGTAEDATRKLTKAKEEQKSFVKGLKESEAYAALCGNIKKFEKEFNL